MCQDVTNFSRHVREADVSTFALTSRPDLKVDLSERDSLIRPPHSFPVSSAHFSY